LLIVEKEQHRRMLLDCLQYRAERWRGCSAPRSPMRSAERFASGPTTSASRQQGELRDWPARSAQAIRRMWAFAMLKAVEQHPAMLFFLDNQQSLGPDSRAGQNRKRGLNKISRAKSWSCIRSASAAVTPGRRDVAGAHHHRLELCGRQGQLGTPAFCL